MSESKASCKITYHETPPSREDQKPGDIWCDEEVLTGEEHSAMFVYLILPDGSDAGALRVYRNKKPEGKYPSWKITGTPDKPESFTMHPSIHLRGSWHGWLKKGVLAC